MSVARLTLGSLLPCLVGLFVGCSSSEEQQPPPMYIAGSPGNAGSAGNGTGGGGTAGSSGGDSGSSGMAGSAGSGGSMCAEQCPTGGFCMDGECKCPAN